MKTHIIGLLVCSLFIFASCEDDPSSVGQELLEDQDVAKFYSKDSNKDNLSITTKTYASDITYGGSSRTLVGNADNLKATALLKFDYNLPDSVKDAISDESLTIQESVLQLNISYNYGNSSVIDVFKLKRIINSWGTGNFDRDSLSQVQYDIMDIDLNQSFTDSTISVEIDKQTSYEWLANSSDDNSFSNYGMLLEPTLNSSRILGFEALSSNTLNSQLLPTLQTVVSFSNGTLDTLFGFITQDAFAVEGAAPEFSNQQFVLQGGLSIRSSLKFDLSKLPKTAVIIDAEFTMQFDSLNSKFGSASSDSVVVSLLKSGSENEIDSTVSSLVLKRNSSSFSGDIKSFIQIWIDEKSNNGMQLRLFDENRAVTKLAFYNENNIEALKPHLKIIYTDIK